ncbi:MAG TPA: hypothetical protein VG738_09610 [Chitinophagaceae bacterium]|nr:hypothetical protein [Chitinophagaceae bacterium]
MIGYINLPLVTVLCTWLSLSLSASIPEKVPRILVSVMEVIITVIEFALPPMSAGS